MRGLIYLNFRGENRRGETIHPRREQRGTGPLSPDPLPRNVQLIKSGQFPGGQCGESSAVPTAGQRRRRQ